jgi:hypothetical protein
MNIITSEIISNSRCKVFSDLSFMSGKKVKGKSIPVTGRGGP